VVTFPQPAARSLSEPQVEVAPPGAPHRWPGHSQPDDRRERRAERIPNYENPNGAGEIVEVGASLNYIVGASASYYVAG
jgi:hypothetical protein